MISFDNSYARLPERFHARVHPAGGSAPRLIAVNDTLARILGIDPAWLRSDEGLQVLAGNAVAAGSEPLAMAYAGHQFGNFVPTLGDGRANLLGEVIGTDGKRYDIQLKGSGQTPFSRRGDGRAALGPVLREYIVSEAMHTLGVPTTRALAAVLTGDRVMREEVLPGAVLTRVAASHIRVGTFEYFGARKDTEGVRLLAEHVITRHYPDIASAAKPFNALLRSLIARQAKLVAQWMLLGFIHGVMNTDNTSVSGETIDYGPCAYMEAFHPGTVYSSIDRGGRYAWANQPNIMVWNLSRFAETLLPLMEVEEGGEQAALDAAYAALNTFEAEFETAFVSGIRRKLGVMTEEPADGDLAKDLLQAMAANRADFTLTFRRMVDAVETGRDALVRARFDDAAAWDAWAVRWRERLAHESVNAEERVAVMKRANPIYIARNHLVQEVIDAAVLREDFAPFAQLNEVLLNPFEERAGLERFAMPATAEQMVTQTFCGT